MSIPTTSDEQRVTLPSHQAKPSPHAPVPSSSPPPISASKGFERWLLRKLLERVGHPRLVIELWDGQRIASPSQEVSECQTIRLRDRRTLWKLLFQPEVEFAEAYTEGRLEIDADLIDLTCEAFRAMERGPRHPWRERLAAWITWPARTLSAARRNVYHHYDLGNDFYKLWLDEQLLYTCAYYQSDQVSLEQAQYDKMDYICRKLCLKAGDHVIEAGCGWGALAMHMAKHYNARVRAYNISKEQIAYAREQARQAGLDDRVTFIEEDWRHITGQCDVFVSVGMLEHVGPENYRRLGKIIQQSLRPEGRGLIHSIGLNRLRPLNRWTSTRIFPGAQPPTLGQAMQIFEPYEMTILDVENLRPHYALTLRHWLQRFEDQADTVQQMFGEQFVRMWRVYLAASVAAFETGCLHLYQILFTPTVNNDWPMTREHWYLP